MDNNSERRAVDEEIDRESVEDFEGIFDVADLHEFFNRHAQEATMIPVKVLRDMEEMIRQHEQRGMYAMSKLLDECYRLATAHTFGANSPSDRLKSIAAMLEVILHQQRGFNKAGGIPEYKVENLRSERPETED